MGRSLHAIQEYSRALAAFNDFIRHRPASAEGYFFAGRTYLTIGMPYKAVPFLRKALEKSSAVSPNKTSLDHSYIELRSKTKALLGTAYLKSKNSLAAVQLLQQAVQEAPSDKRIYRAYLNALLVRGIRLCGIDDYELGLQMLRFVLANGPETGMADNPFLRLHLGRAARETGKLEEALEHFTQALRLSGDSTFSGSKRSVWGDRRIRWSRASILMALGRTAEARKEIEKIRSHDADVPELPWNSELVDLFMIRSFMESAEWRQAAKACRLWLKQNSSGPQSIIHVIYAEALRNMRDYKAAHNHLKKALKENPNELEFWYADILVSWEGRDYASLKRALNAAKALGGDRNIIDRFSILCRFRTSDDTKKIISELQNAIRKMGPEPELMYALGECYLKIGLLEEARGWFNKTITLNDSHESAWLGEIAALEAILSPSGSVLKPGEAALNDSLLRDLASLYSGYLTRWPDNASIRRDRALFLVKTLEYAQAASELEKLLVWEPSNPSLRRVLAYTYRKTGRYQEAAVFLKPLLKEKPRDIGLIIEYSGCLERAGAVHYAVAVLEKSLELFKQSREKQKISTKTPVQDIFLALGILKYRQKDLKKALNWLNDAAVFAPKDSRPYEWMAIIARENGEKLKAAHYEEEAKKRKIKKK